MAAINAAATGMNVQQKIINLIGNNIANVNTIGFKRSMAVTQDLLYQSQAAAGTATGSEAKSPIGQDIGTGVRLAGISRQFTTGDLQETGKELDIAIDGAGFFEVKDANGNPAYTRNGNFHRDKEGKIVTADGFELANAGTLPSTAVNISISANGYLSYIDMATVDRKPVTLGQIQLALFANPNGLTQLGNSLYGATEASGDATNVNPGLDGGGTLSHKYLEMSNVIVVEEMVKMLDAQRAYEMNSKVVRAADEMTQTALQVAR